MLYLMKSRIPTKEKTLLFLRSNRNTPNPNTKHSFFCKQNPQLCHTPSPSTRCLDALATHRPTASLLLACTSKHLSKPAYMRWKFGGSEMSLILRFWSMMRINEYHPKSWYHDGILKKWLMFCGTKYIESKAQVVPATIQHGQLKQPILIRHSFPSYYCVDQNDAKNNQGDLSIWGTVFTIFSRQWRIRVCLSKKPSDITGL